MYTTKSRLVKKKALHEIHIDDVKNMIHKLFIVLSSFLICSNVLFLVSGMYRKDTRPPQTQMIVNNIKLKYMPNVSTKYWYVIRNKKAKAVAKITFKLEAIDLVFELKSSEA